MNRARVNRRQYMVASTTAALLAAPAARALAQGMPSGFNEAPALAALVREGKLPPVQQRLPNEPVVVTPVEGIGHYGGVWNRSLPNAGAASLSARTGYEPLVRWTTDGLDVEAGVARAWEASPDGSIFTFYLREGMRWSDGAPFSANDIMFWYEDILLNEELTPAFPGWLRVADAPGVVEKVDDYTFRFRFAGPYGSFLKQLAHNSLGMFTPAHYLKQFHPRYADAAALEKLVKDAGLDQWYRLFPLRNNLSENPDLPTIRSWKLTVGPPATRIVAERNPYYWKVDTAGNQLPYIDRMTVDIVENNELVNLRAATGQTTFEYQYLQFKNWTLFQEGAKRGDFRVLPWKMGETAVVVYPNESATDPMWRELNQTRDFRLALSNAINREEINDLLYNGLAEPAWKPYIHESEWDQSNEELAARYPELVALYQYEPSKANQLLDNIGLNRRDRDGFRLGPDGKTLEITIEPLFGYVNLYEPFELIREYWNKVGLKTALKPLTIELWWPRIYSSEYNFSGYQNTRVQWLVYPRDWAPLYQHTYWAPNFGYWYDSGGKFGEEPPEDLQALQRMFTRIRETPDDVEREDLSRQLLMTHGMNMYSIPVAGMHATPYVAKNNFRNVPETGYMVWPLMSPGYVHPEQFSIRSS